MFQNLADYIHISDTAQPWQAGFVQSRSLQTFKNLCTLYSLITLITIKSVK